MECALSLKQSRLHILVLRSSNDSGNFSSFIMKSTNNLAWQPLGQKFIQIDQPIKKPSKCITICLKPKVNSEWSILGSGLTTTVNIIITSRRTCPTKQKSSSTSIKASHFKNSLRAVSTDKLRRSILISSKLVIKLLSNIYRGIRMHAWKSWALLQVSP